MATIPGREPVLLKFPVCRAKRRAAILLTSYGPGATGGRNVGVAGYSYDFVASLYRPLLEQWGEVIEVHDPRRHLEAAVAQAREHGLQPIHVAFLPFQDVCLTPSAPNVVAPAWEYPDIPDHAFDNNPQNDWVTTAGRCSLVLVGGAFTANALKDAGVKTPIHIVPVPTPEPYFEVEPWDSRGRTALPCAPYVYPIAPGPSLDESGEDASKPNARRGGLRRALRSSLGRVYRSCVRPWVPAQWLGPLRAGVRVAIDTWRCSRLLPAA